MTSANRWALGAAVLLGSCSLMARIPIAHADGTFFKNRPATAAATPASAAPAPAAAVSPTQPSRAPVATPSPSPATSPQGVSGSVSQVLSTDTLIISGQRVQLAGLRGTTGMSAAFGRWLQSHGNRLSCRAVGARYQCATREGLDVGQVLIINGAAACTPDAPPQYQAAQMQARQARRGIWAH